MRFREVGAWQGGGALTNIYSTTEIYDKSLYRMTLGLPGISHNNYLLQTPNLLLL